MDKYTVDLDQVLNDFEYSELTDQYTNASSRTATGNALSSMQNNVTKHSINNVFHSLNEYLNTSIDINSINQIDNNILQNKKCTQTNVLNVSQNNFRDAESSIIKDCNLKTDALFDFKPDINENNNVSILDSQNEFLEETSDSGDNRLVDIQDGCMEADEGNDGGKEESGEFEETRYGEMLDKALEDTGDKGTLEEGVEDEDVQKEEEKDVGIEETLNMGAAIEETVQVVSDFLEAEKNNGFSDRNDKVEDVDSEETLNKGAIIEEQAQVVTNFIEAEKKIGFSDDIELDDSEITKLLEQLESEDIEIDSEESQTIAPIIGGCEDDSETKEQQDTVSDDKIEENQLVDLQDKVSAVKMAVDVEEKIPQQMGAGDSNTEKNFEVKDNKMEAIDDETAEIDENDDKEESIEVLDENTAIENEPETEISQDSLSRPQNLALHVEGDEPKRKINLIGEPGSTPYNNVYINKEIPRNKDKGYDSDTDYSTSSSPTFSDVSTTASTVSIDEAPTEDRNQKKPPEHEKLSRVASKMHNTRLKTDPTLQTENPTSEFLNPTSEFENPTSEIENPTSDFENPTSEMENPASEGATRASRDGEASEGAAEGSFGAGGAVAASSDSTPHGVENANAGKQWLGKEAPLWIPDSEATSCLHCDMKFTVLKRRHHCRACGLVLCSKCCHLRFRLEYLDAEARVCNKCHDILNKDTNSSSGSDLSPDQGNSPSYRPHPNNPLEYCSTVSPLQQAAGSNPPPAVMVPVGVLKRKGSNKAKSNKSVMFCDGIRPGSDLTNLDNDFDYNNTKTRKPDKSNVAPPKPNKNLPTIDPHTNTFIPSVETGLPPTVSICKTDISYTECTNGPSIVETLKNEQLTFAIHVNLYVHLKIINMTCCINKMAWCFSTEGMINVGQDEIVILLEYIDEESFVPKDVFCHINNVYDDAVKGNSVKEMGLSLHNASNFLDSKNHAGFVYIRPTFQCLEQVIKPNDPYLIGILIHRWETPWAKLFPLRLVLRLGAEYRYYPSPIISTRHRDSVFVEIGHTIINLLADFRNFSYTLPQIRGLTIHMEDKNTTITIPVNRYDQVMKSMNNSSDHILAFAGNFSSLADSHLVCIQDTQGNENCYSTHAINIHNKPRKITGASFIVFNGALKSSSGLTAKSNIVEDGLMIQVLPEHMQQIRESLRAMKDHVVSCGCVNAASDETVNIVWGENDVNFNVGVVSAIDNTPLSGVPSIRVHNGKNHVCFNGSRLIRWTEVFIIKSGDDTPKNQDPVDVSRVSENIAKATCDALVKYLDLLVTNGCQKIGIRTTLHVDNVSYLAGSNGAKLAPIYMKSLDDELIPVLHRITTNSLGDNAVVLELIFRILNV